MYATKTVSLLVRCCTASSALSILNAGYFEGYLTGVSGLALQISGLASFISVGDQVVISSDEKMPSLAKIVGFRSKTTYAMPFSSSEGLGHGRPVRAAIEERTIELPICDDWMGRVIDPLGNPIDGKGYLPSNVVSRRLRVIPPGPIQRARLGARIDLGVCALNVFTTCRIGQRLGLFAGSGVGKSTLLSMLARYTECDVTVFALVGERGREVREFLEDDLGEEGRKRCVVVVATSETSPVIRREAAYSAMSIAEHFRDKGRSVLLLMDSVTRFCFALREISVAAGETPSTRGYPPNVFAELPRLLERAGPGSDRTGRTGYITAFFTVLVEGDDFNEPVADAVRGFLDGHVVLDRSIGERGRYPAIDVLRSLSRMVPGCNDIKENQISQMARQTLATYAQIEDMVRLGAYRTGTDLAMDEAITLAPRIEAAIRQGREERFSINESFKRISLATGMT